MITARIKFIFFQIFLPSIKFQFREPIAVHENTLENDEANEELNETRVDLIDYSRPSDFRQKAVAAKRAGHDVSGGGDGHLNASLSHSSSDGGKGLMLARVT